MKEWKKWEPGVMRAVALLAAFALGLAILVALEAIYNQVTWFAVKRSMVFFFQLWLLVAIPVVLSLRLLRWKPVMAWSFIGFLAVLAMVIPAWYCSTRLVMCGSFGSFTLPIYWTGGGIVVLSVALITAHDST